MKNIITVSSMLGVLILGTVSLFSCSKMDDMNMSDPKLNINYPAAYVVNGQDGTISVIKLETNEVTETLSLMGSGNDMIMWPHHISLHSNHLAIGVPGMDFSAGHTAGMGGMTGKLLVIDPASGATVKNISLSMMNHNTIYSPNGSEIWVPQMDINGKVLVYDALTYALKSTIAVGMMPAELTFSSDGTKAYIANGDDNTVSVINTATKQVTATVAVGKNPVGAWTGTDARMYVDNEDGQSISVINVATDAVGQTIDLGFMPGIASHNGNKKELWVSDPVNAKVHYWTWDQTKMMWVHGGVFTTGAGAHAITFTADGNTAYVTNQTANTVSVVNVSNHTVSKTINVGRKPNGLVLKI
ncbi:hypothetical protein [Flavobacterium hibernum]|uniref:Lipoprotein n=1 Tax=Flavobacterium hibernum TaxID=37752 RepID=A0A0D0F4N9_9FLAO|nr:hypothetical protein [Flavobacterium hibernum]KIO54626.1 hypothetical protein IW18_01065 [Flavobacterium hibernum]OXA84696.1 hypothetical protein B0A73_18975 [Flavobacterium hibernum]